jgi:8-oxo-dGTP diphosphatase
MAYLVKVTGAILVNKGQILIAKRKAGSRLAGKWEFPGGKIEPDESPEDCLIRELIEELSINIQVGPFLGDSIYHYDRLSIQLLIYRAYWVSGEIQIRVHDRIEWVPIPKLDHYDFAPADIPIVEKLKYGHINLTSS